VCGAADASELSVFAVAGWKFVFGVVTWEKGVKAGKGMGKSFEMERMWQLRE
jgi:hypothetical protein